MSAISITSKFQNLGFIAVSQDIRGKDDFVVRSCHWPKD